MRSLPATDVLRLGTRGSALALVQTRRISARLRELAPGLRTEEVVLRTRGDLDPDTPLPSIGGKGLFTEALERALLDGEIDVAVHSLKDLPVEDSVGIEIGAICCRDDPRDALVSRDGLLLAELPAGAVIGTSSTRRAAQLRAARPDLRPEPIRGNVETRIAKVDSGAYDATLLALAGLSRLGLAERATQVLPLDVFLPAPGQGALAVQCRAGDSAAREILARLNDADAFACTTAERSFLDRLGGGCSLPVAALAGAAFDNMIVMDGRVTSADGTRDIRVTGSAPGSAAIELGIELAAEAMRRGAAELLG